LLKLPTDYRPEHTHSALIVVTQEGRGSFDWPTTLLLNRLW
jgi:hypothetical protein